MLRSLFTAAVLLALVFATSCSSGKGSGTGSTSQSTDTTTRANSTSTTSGRPRPAGPAADLSHEITGKTAPFMGAATTVNLARAGYVEHEYLAAGTASSYRAVTPISRDGRWHFAPATKAAYRTRALVRRPANAADFSGTVVVEWLNVSGGLDADPDWASLHEELVRRGDIWVGVSAQMIGVVGGPVLVSVPIEAAKNIAGKGLKAIDPARYGSLEHPGDGYAFDIFTQVARAIRAGGAPTGGATPQRILAAGESQSAFALVSYYNGVQPLTRAFDGFFVHSRGAVGLTLVTGRRSADIAGAIAGTPTIFRTDQTAPVLDVQTESDVSGVLNSIAARQPDSDTFRLWEVAGTAHADAHLIGPIASQLNCGVPINNGPTHVVAKAALHALDAWVQGGTPPPRAPRLETTAGATPQIRRNGDGIALGGIRTPPLDVPVDVLSAAPGPNPSVICLLLGSTKPLPAARLAQLYSSRAAYRQRYDADADKAIHAGYVLGDDRDALLAFAQPSRVQP
jgi:hypothetical protein